MGNTISSVNNDICIICKKHVIKEELMECLKCNIKFHENCYNMEKFMNCPKCQNLNTIKQDLYYKYKYQK